MNEFEPLQERIVALELIIEAMIDDHRFVLRSNKVLSIAVFALALSIIFVNLSLRSM